MYQHSIDSAAIEFAAIPGISGAQMKVLYRNDATGELTVLTRLEPGAEIPRHFHTRAHETVYVLEGDFVEDGQPFGPGVYLVGAAGTDHGPHASRGGCVVITHFSAEPDFNLVQND